MTTDAEGVLTTLRSDERGFGMLEAVISFAVLGVVLAGLAHNLTSAFTAIGMAKQRQTAIALANELVEQVRALPYDQIGLASDDLAGDAAITASSFRGNPVVVVPSPGSVLQPHRTTIDADDTPAVFTRSAYVTAPATAGGARQVTVRVEWSPSSGGGDPVVEVDTLVTEYGCEAQSSARPCESYWYGSADGVPGAIRISGTVLGVDVMGELALSNQHAQVTTEQFTSAAADATSVTGTVGATADDSLTTTIGSYDNPANSGTTGAVAAASATGQSPNASGGALPNDGLAYARSTSTPSTSDSSLTLSGLFTGDDSSLPIDLTLASVLGLSTAGTATAQRDAGSDLTILDDDTVTATATRTLPTVRLVSIPAIGWLAQLQGYSVTATATAGPNGTSVSTSTPNGSLSYRNGASTATHSFTSSTVDLSAEYELSTIACTLDVGGEMTAGGRSTSTEGAAGSSALRARAVAEPALLTSLSVDLSCAGSPIAALTIEVDLGATTADARYAEPGA